MVSVGAGERVGRGKDKKRLNTYDLYQLLVGEIGIPRREFLYELNFQEVKLIIRGYRKRERTNCNMIRWQTFWLLHNGMADLKKAGINVPEDLISFPWDKEDEDIDLPTDEEVADMQDLLRSLNS